MPFYVYILICSDGSYYTGHTDDLEQRLAMHQSGQLPGYTSSRLPCDLAYQASFASRDDAFLAERQIKGWSRAKKKALIEGDWNRVAELARNHQQQSRSSCDKLRVNGRKS